jgi:hypothetical protein
MFRIVVVMNSRHLGGLGETCTWVPASPSARKFTIQGCYDSFVLWKEGLDKSPNRFDGNVVGAAKQDPFSGTISISDPEIVIGRSESSVNICLGEPIRARNLSHCNFVALKSGKFNRFVKTSLGKIAATDKGCQIDNTMCDLPYLVLRIAENEFAFYSVHWNSFIAVKSPDEVIPIQQKNHLNSDVVSDERILSRIPEGAVFIVKSEGSIGSAMSLYSEKFETFVTMTDDGKVNASATSPGDSELFHIVLLMKVDLFGE